MDVGARGLRCSISSKYVAYLLSENLVAAAKNKCRRKGTGGSGLSQACGPRFRRVYQLVIVKIIFAFKNTTTEGLLCIKFTFGGGNNMAIKT